MAVDIRKPLKKFLPHLLEARAASLNEADTVQRLTRLFEEVLGYDPMSEISREAQMKGKFVDVTLKIDGDVRLLVEAKAAPEKLRDRHIEQAQSYASRNNYRWVLLTNGLDWYLYHLTFEEGIEYERAFTIDLTVADSFDVAAERLALLHRQSIKRGDLDEFWEKTRALGPKSIGKALFRENVLMLIRREIRRDEGFLIDREDLARAIHGLLSTEAREQIGPARVGKVRRTTTRPTGEPPPSVKVEPVADQEPAGA